MPAKVTKPIGVLIHLRTGRTIITSKKNLGVDEDIVRILVDEKTRWSGFPYVIKNPLVMEVPLHNIDFVVFYAEEKREGKKER